MHPSSFPERLHGLDVVRGFALHANMSRLSGAQYFWISSDSASPFARTARPRRAPTRGLDAVSTTSSPSLTPRAALQRRLGALATKRYETSGPVHLPLVMAGQVIAAQFVALWWIVYPQMLPVALQ